MSGKLIVLTGVHNVVRRVVSADTEAFSAIPYYPSISDALQQRDASSHWETCPFYESLLMYRELERDSAILALIEERNVIALIEQWHVGNIAWAKTRSSEVGIEYEERLRELLERLGEVDIRTWHISTDLEKMSAASFRSAYQMYLGELSNITRHFRLPVETLDGDAPIEIVSKRVKYLLRG